MIKLLRWFFWRVLSSSWEGDERSLLSRSFCKRFWKVMGYKLLLLLFVGAGRVLMD